MPRPKQGLATPAPKNPSFHNNSGLGLGLYGPWGASRTVHPRVSEKLKKKKNRLEPLQIILLQDLIPAGSWLVSGSCSVTSYNCPLGHFLSEGFLQTMVQEGRREFSIL